MALTVSNKPVPFWLAAIAVITVIAIACFFLFAYAGSPKTSEDFPAKTNANLGIGHDDAGLAAGAVVQGDYTGLAADALGQDGDQDGVELPGANAKTETGNFASAQLFSCLLPLPQNTQGFGYQRNVNCEIWRGSAKQSSRDYARDFLLGLRDSGFSLACSGFMSLSDEIWGATLQAEDNTAYLVTVKQTSTAAQSPEAMVSVVHILIPGGDGDEY